MRCVVSRNLKKEDTIARFVPQRHGRGVGLEMPDAVASNRNMVALADGC